MWCSWSGKSVPRNNWFNKLLTNDLYNTVWPASKVCLCCYTSPSNHPQILPRPLTLVRLTPFRTAIHRSIHCRLKTTGHNKCMILFTIKAPVAKWIPLMYKFIFQAQLKKRGRQNAKGGLCKGLAIMVPIYLSYEQGPSCTETHGESILDAIL